LPYADDAVPFLAAEGCVMAGRIPQRPRLREPAASLYAEASGRNSEEENTAELLHDVLATLRPLRVIYWLQPVKHSTGGPAASLDRVPRVEALPLLLSEARFLSLRDGACNRKMVRNYLLLASLVPVFRCRYSLCIEQLGAVVDCLWQHYEDLTKR
jgi:hypothetical protein